VRRSHRGDLSRWRRCDVVPYDPVRERVLLIEQFRQRRSCAGDAIRGWMEPIAGRVDAAEGLRDRRAREADRGRRV